MPDVREARGGDILTIALGAIVVMWTILYLAAIPPGLMPLWIAFGFVCAVLLLAGVIAARSAGRTVVGGAVIGASIALVNLIILSSALSGDTPGEVVLSGAKWIAGFAGAAVVLCAIGAAIGRTPDIAPTAPVNWTGRFAVVAAITTLLMIIAGGIVTGLEAGLAIEGWLTADGFLLVLFPLEMMQLNVEKFAEHAHRLWGLLVGLTTLVLAVRVWTTDRRSWLRTLALATVVAVIIQGVLGGMRVTETSTVLGVVHGVFAHVFLAGLVWMAAALSTTWTSNAAPSVHRGAQTDRLLSLTLLAMLLIQITLGATFRQIQPIEGVSSGVRNALLHSHSFVGSMLVLLLAGGCGVRAWGMYGDIPVIRRTGVALLTLVALQIVLGFVAFVIVPHDPRPAGEAAIPPLEVAVSTAHQAVGALLLSCATLHALWVRRMATQA